MASLTWDRNTELAYHSRFSVTTAISVYFCDPQSPWQRGSNENTNGLLRQYFPKGTDLTSFSQDNLDQVALKLNMRPRKTLGYATPSDGLDAALALTAWTHHRLFRISPFLAQQTDFLAKAGILLFHDFRRASPLSLGPMAFQCRSSEHHVDAVGPIYSAWIDHAPNPMKVGAALIH